MEKNGTARPTESLVRVQPRPRPERHADREERAVRSEPRLRSGGGVGAGGAADESLGTLMNPAKTRSARLENDVSSEMSSDMVKFKRESRLPGVSQSASESSPPPEPEPERRRSRPAHRSAHRSGHRSGHRPPPSSSSSSPESNMSMSDDEDDESDDGMVPPFQEANGVELQVQRAVRKAKLLARIDQLKGRGVMPSKEYTYRASEDELVTEVARMEVLAQRSIRIQQGRAVFISGIGGLEKLMNKSDENEWLPIAWHMEGFTRVTTRDITNYDDPLERGVESMLGEAGSMPWYAELAMILIPAMVTHSMMQRFKDSPEHTNEVLKSNPQLRETVARELAQEMHRSEQHAAAEAAESIRAASAPPAASGAQPRMRMQPPRGPPSAAMRPEPPAPDMSHAPGMQVNIERNNESAKQRQQIQQQEARLNNLEEQLRVARMQAEAAERRAAEAVSQARRPPPSAPLQRRVPPPKQVQRRAPQPKPNRTLETSAPAAERDLEAARAAKRAEEERRLLLESVRAEIGDPSSRTGLDDIELEEENESTLASGAGSGGGGGGAGSGNGADGSQGEDSSSFEISVN